MGDGCWRVFEDHSVPSDPPAGRSLPANSEEEISACRDECVALGFSGFVVRRGGATLLTMPRSEVLAKRSSGFWDRGSALHVAPEPEAAEGDIVLEHEEVSVRASSSALAARSGYFAALFRHHWREDGSGTHSFSEFPGGPRAFALAAAWLRTEAGRPIGDPWPVRDSGDACGAAAAAAYLDAPALLRAALRSWRLSGAHVRDDLLTVAAAVTSASLQFVEEDQGPVIKELSLLLQELPRHQLTLAPDFLASPAGGLAILEARKAARQTIVGHIRTVGGWVGSVIGGGPEAAGLEDEGPMSPHDFATRLFGTHEAFFLARPPMLRQLFTHINSKVPIAPPLCFRVAGAAGVAHGCRRTKRGDQEPLLASLWAAEVFECGLGAAQDPISAAADDACVAGLFGAGGRAEGAPLLGLDVLARKRIPPSAATVILSRVLSSWATTDCLGGQEGRDGADVILAGVGEDRQRLRRLLEAVLPEVVEGTKDKASRSERGSCFDFAVPELLAAFTRSVASASPTERDLSTSSRLLFRLLFQPSGGLPGLRLPVTLFAELRCHNEACVSLAARRALEELRTIAAQDRALAWESAEALWPCLVWDSLDVRLVDEAVQLLRAWLTEGLDEVSAALSVRLFRGLPLHRISEPEEALGPPVPAHVLAGLAYRLQEQSRERITALEAENRVLREELLRLSRETQRLG